MRAAVTGWCIARRSTCYVVKAVGSQPAPPREKLRMILNTFLVQQPFQYEVEYHARFLR